MGKNVKNIRSEMCSKCGKAAHRIRYQDKPSRVEHYLAADGKACKAARLSKTR